MAKKQDLSGIFKKTDIAERPAADAIKELDRGNIKSTGVGLRAGELQTLEEIGRALGERLGAEPIARNAITRIAIRRFLEQYLTGALTVDDLAGYFEVPEKPAPKLKM